MAARSLPTGSSIASVADLKEKKVAMFKGTNIQLAINKILEKNGLTEKNVRFISMDTATAKAALVTGDIDAAFGGADYLALRDQGFARIIYNSRDDDPRFLRHASFVGSADFIEQYPDITQRIVKNLVIAAKWISDQDENRAPVFQLYAKSGVSFGNYKEDLAGQSIKVNASPLLDPYLTSTYKANILEAKRFSLTKNDIDFERWVEPSFLNRALAEQNLTAYWKTIDPSGNWKS